jgi:glycosyltransferase involved in cell wall biosynthesis
VTKKKVWLINPMAMPPKYEARIQTIKRAQYLSESGYDVTVIAGSFLHNSAVNLIRDKRKFMAAEYDGLKFIHIRNRNYSSNGWRRIYSMLEFYFRLWRVAGSFQRPDVIALISAVPFCNIVYFIAKKFHAKLIVDVVDLWPESFVAYGLVSAKNPVLRLAYMSEKWLYKRADALVFSMEGGRDYIVEKKWDSANGGPIDLNKIFYINNGVDLSDFDRNCKEYRISDPDLENDSLFKVIYIGSVRHANNLKQLVDAAAELRSIPAVRFLIYGDGEDRQWLENYCVKNGITNVLFKEKWVELKYVPYILSRSSLNILNYMKTPILRFGGSQSKSFQYMASGKPICANVMMSYCPIKRYDIGTAREFDSPSQYAQAILKFYEMDPARYRQLCSNARLAAADYDYRRLTDKFEKLLDS